MEQKKDANRKQQIVQHIKWPLQAPTVSHSLVQMSNFAAGITMLTSCSKNVLVSTAYLLFHGDCTVGDFF